MNDIYVNIGEKMTPPSNPNSKLSVCVPLTYGEITQMKKKNIM